MSYEPLLNDRLTEVRAIEVKLQDYFMKLLTNVCGACGKSGASEIESCGMGSLHLFALVLHNPPFTACVALSFSLCAPSLYHFPAIVSCTHTGAQCALLEKGSCKEIGKCFP